MAVPRIIIFGASGFIGQHLTQALGFEKCLPVSRLKQNNGDWFEADLLKSSTINLALKHGTTVINLAYSSQVSTDENITMAKNLVRACLQSNISRIIHCSTAIVVGKNTSYLVNENTPCYPETGYERTKYAIENIFLKAASSRLKVYILRPTAVIGPNGRNLKKMLSEIRFGYSFINYVRSSIYGSRQLNLVSVNDVVRALIHLSDQPNLSSGVFNCSADDDVNNRYDHVERMMRTILKKPSLIKTIPLPRFILSILLRISRSGSGHFANRHYSAEKLANTGFKRSIIISDAVRDFVLSEIA